MSEESPYRRILDAEGYAHVARIANAIPEHFEVSRYRTDETLIEALGDSGAYDALRALQSALQDYWSDLIVGAVRTCCGRPLAPEPPFARLETWLDEVWPELFEVPWESQDADRSAPRTLYEDPDDASGGNIAAAA